MRTQKNKKAVTSILALMIFFVVMTASSCSSNNPSSDDGSSHNVNNPFGIYSPGSLDEVSGSARQKIIDALGVDTYAAFQDFNIESMREVGVSWVRVDFWYDGSDFLIGSEAYYLEKLRTAGFEVIGGIRPVDNLVPADSKFEADVRGLVENYPWIATWQIGNEPNLSLSNPDEYSRIFLAGARAVREACPTCRVMLAGVSLRFPSQEQARQIYQRLLPAIVAQSGTDKPFDAFDLHLYGMIGDEDALLSGIREYRRILKENGIDEDDVEIWLTETATPTGKPVKPVDAPAQTEDQQAGELVRRFVAGLGAGLKRVAWARPYENYRYSDIEDGFFDLTGLIYNGLGQEADRGVKAGTKKKSWYAFQTLVTKVKGFREVINHAPGVYEFRFGEGESPVFVVWASGAPSAGGQLLPDEVRGQIKVTDLIGNETATTSDALVPAPEPVFVERS